MFDHNYKLAFQPIYRRQHLGLWGYEVLVRQVAGGLIHTPRDFFANLNSGRDWWLLDFKVLNLCRARDYLNHCGLNLTLNVSAHTLGNKFSRLRYIRELERFNRTRTGGKLILELPESLSMDADELAPIIRHLHDIGVYCAMDDYGREFSDMKRLNALPWDYCKIDWTRANRANVNLDQVAAVCALSGIKTIVEGVESRDDLSYIAQRPVDALQGFALAKPMISRDQHLLHARARISI